MSMSLRRVPSRAAGAARIAVLLTGAWTCGVFAQAPASSPAPPPQAQPSKPATAADTLPPLPPDAHVDQTISLNGKTLKYTATVGTIPVYGKDNKKSADVVYTAYTMEGRDRPVTFAFNGGPGAASVYLNLGAIGPKIVQFGDEGDSPSDPPRLKDNPGTWLDVSDLVFIDPVGTGFSRSYLTADETRREFYTADTDIAYLSRVVFDWLVKNERLQSRKYLVGESYGGYRGPRLTHYLQSQIGVAVNGLFLVSPYLNPSIDENADLSPMAWIINLPSMAAAHLERTKSLTPAAMANVISYARGDYATDLLKGRSDPQALDRIVKRVTDLTGLDPAFVRHSGGRIDINAYLREVAREQGKIGSVYDSNVTSFDPFPFAPDQRSNDPLLESIIAPTTSAMVDFVTRVVGWKVSARYNALSYEVAGAWERNSPSLRNGSVPDLRQAVAADPKLRVLIAHGWNDLSCPFMGSVLTVDQMPVMGDPGRVQVREYPGGHMFYSRPDSRAAFKKDVAAVFEQH
jgi:carboxypeptidase C (cathepsin A)